MAAVPLPQDAHSPQDEEEWETEEQFQLNLGDETDDNQVVRRFRGQP